MAVIDRQRLSACAFANVALTTLGLEQEFVIFDGDAVKLLKPCVLRVPRCSSFLAMDANPAPR